MSSIQLFSSYSCCRFKHLSVSSCRKLATQITMNRNELKISSRICVYAAACNIFRSRSITNFVISFRTNLTRARHSKVLQRKHATCLNNKSSMTSNVRETFYALEILVCCWPFQHRPCDFSCFSHARKIWLRERWAENSSSLTQLTKKTHKKVFHLSVRFDIFVVPQVEVEKVVSLKKMIFFELKRKSGKDLWGESERF